MGQPFGEPVSYYGPELLDNRAHAGFDAMFTPAGNNTEHRSKHIESPGGPLLGAARPVAKNAYLVSEQAMEAYWKEWKNLERKQTWRMGTLAESTDVVHEAKTQLGDVWNSEVHFGYLSRVP